MNRATRATLDAIGAAIRDALDAPASTDAAIDEATFAATREQHRLGK